jgi:hypothetical protein
MKRLVRQQHQQKGETSHTNLLRPLQIENEAR